MTIKVKLGLASLMCLSILCVLGPSLKLIFLNTNGEIVLGNFSNICSAFIASLVKVILLKSLGERSDYTCEQPLPNSPVIMIPNTLQSTLFPSLPGLSMSPFLMADISLSISLSLLPQ
jgi:hypothetical protein